MQISTPPDAEHTAATVQQKAARRTYQKRGVERKLVAATSTVVGGEFPANRADVGSCGCLLVFYWWEIDDMCACVCAECALDGVGTVNVLMVMDFCAEYF